MKRQSMSSTGGRETPLPFREAAGTLPQRCVVCSSPATPYREVRGYLYHRCTHCGLQFIGPGSGGIRTADVYGDNYFFGGGAGYPNYLQEQALLVNHGRRYARIVSRFASPSRLLDVGSAAGFILKGFIDAGWAGVGIEPNATMAAYANTRLGVDVRMGTIEAYRAPELFDLITMIQVLEHVVDLDASLVSAAAATKTGGLWLIESMDGASFLAKLFGIQWHGYSPPSVRCIFTPTALRILARRFGFEPLAAGHPRKWLSGAHVKSLLAYKASDGWANRVVGIAARLLPDELSLPYPGRDLMWSIYRKLP